MHSPSLAATLAALLLTCGTTVLARGATLDDGGARPTQAVESVEKRTTPLTPPATSARLQRPLTVSAALNFPFINGGVDVSYQLTDRLALGGQLTTMLIHTELTARARYFLLTSASSGLYVGLNGVFVHSPLIFSFPAVGATAELGFEVRRDTWVFGFGAGAGAVWTESAEGRQPGDLPFEPYPVVNFRIGRSRP